MIQSMDTFMDISNLLHNFLVLDDGEIRNADSVFLCKCVI